MSLAGSPNPPFLYHSTLASMGARIKSGVSLEFLELFFRKPSDVYTSPIV